MCSIAAQTYGKTLTKQMKNYGFEQMSSILKLDTTFKGELFGRFGLRLNLCAFVRKAPHALRCLWLNSAEHVGPCPEWGR
jgi:hypothetical protein